MSCNKKNKHKGKMMEKEFLEEYRKLCEKYNLIIEPTDDISDLCLNQYNQNDFYIKNIILPV